MMKAKQNVIIHIPCEDVSAGAMELNPLASR